MEGKNLYNFELFDGILDIASSIAKCNTWESRKEYAILRGLMPKQYNHLSLVEREHLAQLYWGGKVSEKYQKHLAETKARFLESSKETPPWNINAIHPAGPKPDLMSVNI